MPVTSIYSGPMAGGIGPPGMQPMPQGAPGGGRDLMAFGARHSSGLPACLPDCLPAAPPPQSP